MGNTIAKKYDLPTQHSASAGLCKLFKIYHGTNKENQAEISVWNLSKDDLLKRVPPIKDKSVQEQLYAIIRKDINSIKDNPADCSGLLRAIEVSYFFYFKLEFSVIVCNNLIQ